MATLLAGAVNQGSVEGTTGYIPLWDPDGRHLGDSGLSDDGTNITNTQVIRKHIVQQL